MIEYVMYKGSRLAIIIRSGHKSSGNEFLTPNEYSQQIGVARYPSGKKIQPHIHKRYQYPVFQPMETLVIQKGILQIDFYSPKKEFLESRTLQEGDVALLCGGGHGFTVVDDLKMVEIKQGPFAGDGDKERF